ncbi:MAG: hypothetical protein KTR14_09640, partial [Vampirovibrio sp.]|nr:hypothetical protein [Vampirovibrio sp.]
MPTVTKSKPTKKPAQKALTLTAQSGDITQAKVDALIVNLFDGVKKPAGGTGAVDKALGGIITQEIKESATFTGKLGQTLVLHTHGKIQARYVIVVGLGDSKKLDAPALRRAAAAAAKACQSLQISTAATLLHGAGIGNQKPEPAARLLAEGSLLGSYTFTNNKHPQHNPGLPKVQLKTITVVEHDKTKLTAIKKGLTTGSTIATHVNLAREWVYEPPNIVTPTYLKKQAEGIKGLTCKVLSFAQLKKMGMGAFTLVAQGSDEPSYLIHLSYKPKGKKPKKKVTLVGKGITFDSGGLSLKPPKSQELMKMDMAGAAAVLATMGAIAQLGNLDIQVDGFIPTCENMPSGRSSKPGDVITAYNGKTVEVNNTDAEGRLILCDAMAYAQELVKPDEMIDLATLT